MSPRTRRALLDSGEKVLLEAMQQNGQDKNPAAWYYLGRIYLSRVTSTAPTPRSTRAEQLAPDCAKEIDGYRQNAWVALIKGGNKFEEQKNLDSALVLYRQAGVIFRASPIPYYQAAIVFNDKGQTDSAAVYFGKAVAAGGQRDRHDRAVKIRNRSAFNQGALLLNGKKYRPRRPSVFEQYLKWAPNDIEAKRGLAAAYRGSGKVGQGAGAGAAARGGRRRRRARRGAGGRARHRRT